MAPLKRLSALGMLFVLIFSSFSFLPLVASASHYSSEASVPAVNNSNSLGSTSSTPSSLSLGSLFSPLAGWITHIFSQTGSIIGLNAATSCAAKPVCVNFTETGLPAATTWQVTFNSVAYSNTTTASGVGVIYIGGLTPGSTYFWSTSSSVQISKATRYTILNQLTSADMTIPTGTAGGEGGQLTQALVYTQQYNVTLAVSTTDGYTNPYMGNYWYNAGSTIPISLAVLYGGCGCAFTSWTSSNSSLKLASTTSSATTAAVNSAGTITANFKTLTYPITFVQAGLPKGTTWSVTVGSTTVSNTTSLSTGAGQITFSGVNSLSYGSHSWTVENPVPSTISGEQFVPVDQYGGSVFVPSQTVQEVVFDKQYEVTFSVTGGSTVGSTNPSSGSWWYNAGSTVSISAWPTSTQPGGEFSSWSITGSLVLGSTTAQSTSMTVNGPGTAAADFAGTVNVCGSSTTPCTLKFVESGLPSGTIWSVNYAPKGESSTTAFSNSTNTIFVHGVTASGYAAVATDIYGGSGVQYVPTYYICQSNFCQQPGSATSYYMNVPQQLLLQVVYTKQYLVNFQTSTPNTGNIHHSTSTLGASSGASSPVWFYAGSNISVAADPSTSSPYTFKSWSHSSGILLSSTSKESVSAQINGAGSITASINLVTYTIKFTEVGLPSGSIWSVVFNGLTYSSSTSSISIKAVGGGSSYSWSATQDVSSGTVGIRYDASSDYSGSMSVPSQTTQMVIYTKQFEVTFIECGGVTGCTNSENDGYIIPSAGSYWYNANAKVAITIVPTSDSDSPADAESFVSWSVSSGSLITIANVNVQSTVMTVGGAGTITGEVS